MFFDLLDTAGWIPPVYGHTEAHSDGQVVGIFWGIANQLVLTRGGSAGRVGLSKVAQLWLKRYIVADTAVAFGRGVVHAIKGELSWWDLANFAPALSEGISALRNFRRLDKAADVAENVTRGSKGAVTMAEGSPTLAGNKVAQYAKKVKGIDGFTDVFIHGTRDGKDFSVIHNGKEVILNQRQIAKWLKSQGITGNIRLISCFSGSCISGSVAQNFANKL